MIKYHDILVPTDFSDGFDHALNHAVEFAKSTGATIHIVNILQSVTYPIGVDIAFESFAELEKEMLEQSKANLEELEAKMKEEEISCKTEILFGRASDKIIDYAAHHDVDLICIATHGASGFEHLLFGSTTEKVLRKATCPVMVVRFPID